VNVLRRFSLTCKTLGRTVILETADWFVLSKEGISAIHFRALCACGKEHVGINLPSIFN
jgi:hypothetical protein